VIDFSASVHRLLMLDWGQKNIADKGISPLRGSMQIMGVAEDVFVSPNMWTLIEMEPLREHAQFWCGVLGNLILIERCLQLIQSKGR
jgi:hypothetical protein